MADILLIEDNPDISFIYQEALGKAGHTVDVATDGQSGIDKAFSQTYNLIFLDLMLPGKHGMQVLQELRDDVRTQDTPIYVLSALSDRIIIDQARSIGANGFLVKSEINPGELVEKVEEYLAGVPEQS